MPASDPRAYRFGVFELDVKAGELRKSGLKLKLQGQPIRVLEILLQHAGEVVAREEFHRRLWSADTFVDFDHGLNNSIKRLREVLDDSAGTPRYVETLARRGYRFICPAETIPEAATVGAGEAGAPPSPKTRVRLRWLLAAALVVLMSGAIVTWAFLSRRTPRTAPAPDRPVRIAVLPFENLSADATDEYLADGITEELITRCSRLQGVEVISRTSVMQFRGAHGALPQIARELQVDAIVEGAVQRSGDRVKISAQLVDAPADRHLWADSYDHELRDILSLESELAGNIAREIQLQLLRRADVANFVPAAIGAHDPEAHLLYLKGQYYWHKQTPEGYEKSRQLFQEALDKDPLSAPAYNGLCFYYAIAGDEGWLPPREAWPKAKAAAEQALQIDSDAPEAHLCIATYRLLFEWNFAAAQSEFQRALHLNPSFGDSYREYAIYLRTVGRTDDAIRSVQHAVALSPLSASMSASLGWTYFYAHRYDDAIAQFKKTLQMDANSEAAHFGLAKAYDRKGADGPALAEFAAVLRLAGRDAEARDLERIYSASGYATAMAALERGEIASLQRAAQTTAVPAIYFATHYAILGDSDQAFEWLEKAYQARSSKLLDLKLDPDFNRLHSDPRFTNLVRRIGLP